MSELHIPREIPHLREAKDGDPCQRCRERPGNAMPPVKCWECEGRGILQDLAAGGVRVCTLCQGTRAVIVVLCAGCATPPTSPTPRFTPPPAPPRIRPVRRSP